MSASVTLSFPDNVQTHAGHMITVRLGDETPMAHCSTCDVDLPDVPVAIRYGVPARRG